MTKRIVSILILVISCVAPIVANAASGCAEANAWSCFGTIEVDTWSTHCKSSTFRNGDRLIEARVTRRGKSTHFQKLAIEPLFHELYDGDDGLYMIAYGMIHVVTDAFRNAYPDGVKVVPEGPSVKNTVIYSTEHAEIPLALATDRSRLQIKYSIRFADDTEIRGVWDSQFPEPLPDDYDVKQWRHRMPQEIKTLYDVRSLK